MSETSTRTISIGLFAPLTLIFVAAKVFHFINWSWWLVFLPIWGPMALGFAVMLLVGTVFLMAMMIQSLGSHNHFNHKKSNLNWKSKSTRKSFK